MSLYIITEKLACARHIFCCMISTLLPVLLLLFDIIYNYQLIGFRSVDSAAMELKSTK